MSVTQHNRSILMLVEEGDILEFKRGIYSHYGVYVGNGEVVHLSGEDEYDGLGAPELKQLFTISGQTFNKAWVKKDDFWTVAGNSEAKISNKDSKKRQPIPKHKVVQNALSKLGRIGYNLMYSNCEHFANWCRYEIEKSDQVDAVLTGAFLGVAAAGALAFVSWMSSGNENKNKKNKQLQ